MTGFGGVSRVWAAGLLAVAVWFLSVATYAPPEPLGLDAPADAFSAARADQVLARILGPEIPHPVSSAENAAVRARIRAEFEKLGISTTIQRGTGCTNAKRRAVVLCGTVTNILAQVRPGQGKAILLLAHYDSVPAGPGAADDESGVAVVLETARALKAVPPESGHPVLALITDGEEAGLLGADLFLHDPVFKTRIGAVINVEARGNQGPSLLFQTSAHAGPLIGLYAAHAVHYAASSLFAEIYKRLPNDTDLTLFIRDGIPALNFAFSGNVAHYHTPLDTRANLSRASLQHQGENMLTMARALDQANLAQLKGPDWVYVTVLGRFLPRMPQSWALPFALAGFLVLCALFSLGFAGPRENGSRIGHWLLVGLVPPLLIAASVAAGFALHGIAQMVSGQPDPSFAYPLALRIALAFGVWTIVLLCARFMRFRAAAFAAWGWFGVLAIATAIFAPGICPYFLFPLLIAVALFAIATFLRTGPVMTRVIVFLAALPALLLWIGLTASGESVMGLRLHPLFTVTAAFALLPLLAIMDVGALSRRAWLLSTAFAALIAVVAAGVQGLQPAFSAIAPQRLNITYMEDHAARRAVWAVDATAPLPQGLREAAHFSQAPEKLSAFAFGKSYIAPAGAVHMTPPRTVAMVLPARDGLRRINLSLSGSADTARMFVVVPKTAQLKGATVLRRIVAPNAAWSVQDAVIGCMTEDCRAADISLLVGSRKEITLTVAEQIGGLPPDGAKLLAARPKSAVPSQSGDVTVITTHVTIPGQ
jgi:hypothetical protein